jgi:hypothetical protein
MFIFLVVHLRVTVDDDDDDDDDDDAGIVIF